MYTIRQAARLSGVSEASLRAWERRYGVVVPQRNPSGYRLYSPEDLAAISIMRRLVQEGWSPAEAAKAVLAGTVPDAEYQAAAVEVDPDTSPAPGEPDAAMFTQLFLSAAARLDTAGIEESLDRGFALGSFEHVVDSWLFPALQLLGRGWASGEVDIAAERVASQAVHRRLSAAFEAAGSRSRGPVVVVGLPSGSQHDLGALAFATAIRRCGLDVLYLGANVPVDSWDTAVRSRSATAAVLAVVTPADRPSALVVAERLLRQDVPPIVCSGGASGAHLAPGVKSLPASIGAAAGELEDLLSGAGSRR
jgi:DNA-binding transcriptional MerR regulator/methylmalonyl-CoA mutase cobalamin-binding subunit